MPGISFVLSGAKAFTRTTDQQLKLTQQIQGLFGQVTAVQPLWGLGSWTSGQDLSGYDFRGFTNIGRLVANNDWPCIYNQCVETFSRADGNVVTITTTYSQYADIIFTSTTVDNGIGGGVPPQTYVSGTVTPTLITIVFSYGVYTAQLSGTLLNPSATGPFDPTDATYGWAAINNLALGLLNLIPVPSATGSNYLANTIVWPISTAPGYSTITYTAGTGTPTPPPYFPSSGGTKYVLCASCNGVPVQVQNLSNPLQEEMYVNQPSIIDIYHEYPFTPGTLNYGGCISSKSIWKISGSLINFFIAGGGVTSPTNDHKNIYAQQISLNSTLGSGVVLGSVLSAPNYPHPISVPQTISFNPSDATSNAGTSYGLLGFWPTAS